MGKDRLIGVFGASVLGVLLVACSGDTEPTSAPQSSHETPLPSATVRPTEKPRDLVTVTSSPTAARTATAVSGVDRALKLDGLQDGVEIESGGILFSNNFRIEAKIRMDQNFPVSGGDTVVSKGENFAAFARSLSTRCLGRVGALIDGRDFCTDRQLNSNTWYDFAISYDGKVLTFSVDGAEIGRDEIAGPLQISNRDIILGRRPGLTNQAPLAGSIDDLMIFDNGQLVVSADFNGGFSDTSGQNRGMRSLGDPRVEVR